MKTATATIKPRRESIVQKAARLLADEGNVRTLGAKGDKWWVGSVAGDHGTYSAFAISEEYANDPAVQAFLRSRGIRDGRIGCTCPAGRVRRLCAHALMAEEMRRRGAQVGML